ncbi:MAG: DUF1329 domain-containing protein [Pseudomonadota bacterium]
MRSLRLTAGWVLALLLASAQAQQYRSETREIETPPAQQAQVDLASQLQNTTDPYAKAMLLRELAGAAVSAKKYPEAKKYLEQALALNALSGPAAVQMRDNLKALAAASGPSIKQGNYKAQIPQLEKRAKEAGAPPEIFIALGVGYIEASRYADAIPWLQKGIAAVPNPDPTWKRALLASLIAAGREAEALPLLQEQVKRQPQQGENWLQLAALALKAGDKERAAAVLELAGRQGHLKTANERLQLVTLTAQIGAPFAAASQAQTWLEQGLIAKTAGNWATLGALWSRAREPGLASTALEEANRLAPDAQRLLQIGQLQMDREDYARAALNLQKGIQAGAKSGVAWMTLAMAHYQQADVDAAAQAFEQAATYPQSRKMAQDWLRYLRSGEAREQALAAMGSRKPRDAGTVTLADKFAGAPVQLEGVAEPAYVPRDAAQTVSAAGGSSGALTPIGAEKGGSPDGRIPAWSGGITPGKIPAGFRKGGRLVDPYPGDKPLFTISAGTMAQYAANLSPGHRALFAKYSDYTMPVFQSRRSVAYPQAIYDATQANLGKVKLLGSDALSGARLGFPFAKPQNGVEVMWNHRTRYRGDATQTQSTQAIVRPSGAPQYLKQTERVYYRYANLKDPADMSATNVLLYYLTWFGATANAVDFTALVHETANSEQDQRAVWVIPPKIPKMFRIPAVGYDQPFPGSDALQFIDMIDMYNGAFDRYVWRLIGKREMYIPYNAYRISDGSWKYPQLLKSGHFNQAATRYELHRVWVIEATERGGKRHAFGKRSFYVDEDSWNVVLVENEDRDGRLWRFQEGHLAMLYENQSANTLPVINYDLKDGRYFINRLLGEDVPAREVDDIKQSEFLPASVRQRYAR